MLFFFFFDFHQFQGLNTSLTLQIALRWKLNLINTAVPCEPLRYVWYDISLLSIKKIPEEEWFKSPLFAMEDKEHVVFQYSSLTFQRPWLRIENVSKTFHFTRCFKPTNKMMGGGLTPLRSQDPKVQMTWNLNTSSS